ncbi:MAG: bifunctional (p)ppGpp synthetase/guanosine-3',5'-bis(diphosphate) 3'-pyrophosphohydrolase [Oscillospiraceae bacterium]|jgi:GTP pyrophosphokinase|nr:bifunctional (p)ppGpp synthetase/guanosine-3',5'-bis(diphosphate) 3'-pyrophosphohydrolase [Oscillospiraceae bacterium]
MAGTFYTSEDIRSLRGYDLYLPLRERVLEAKQFGSEVLQYNHRDVEMIDRAFCLAATVHNTLRESGEPYISHPLAVMSILLDYHMNAIGLCAALLHDVVEDTGVTSAQIQKQFGPTVRLIVDGLTKIQKFNFANSEDAQAENVRKMLLAMSKDERVIEVKLADRLHNMRTLMFKKDEQRRRDIAKETYDIFVPIADRLGMRRMKEELEDLSLRYLDPIAYEEIEKELALAQEQREAVLENIRSAITKALTAFFKKSPAARPEDVERLHNFYIDGRVKTIPGIFRKMYQQHKTFQEISDVYALRIILPELPDCYTVISEIYRLYQPVPNRYKDYIANPKPNGYQSIHNTLYSTDGIRFEIQIRTYQMHYIAEYGVAAHWIYKITKKKDAKEVIRKLVDDVPADSENAQDVVETIKKDIAPRHLVYALSPKQTVYTFPEGATVMDFAYAVHTNLGHCMIGAKVDSKIVPFDYKLQSGDVVEIQRAGTPQLKREWLNIAYTSHAKAKIRAWFRREQRDENIREGRITVQRELQRSFIRLDAQHLDEMILKVTSRKAYTTTDDFYAAVGCGDTQFTNYIPKFREEYQKHMSNRAQESPEQTAKKPKRTVPNEYGIVIDGQEGLKVTLAPCCSPMPGDFIVGHVTQQDGMKIHSVDCQNVPKNFDAADDRDRWLPAHWTETADKVYPVNLTIICRDGLNRAGAVTRVIAENGVNIRSMHFDPPQDDIVTIFITLDMKDLASLEQLMQKINMISAVEKVYRKGRR